ncbi:MAG: hypothetical protein ACFFDF_18125, partial [Candidatus Odinarchaeota archaeon]
FSKFLFFQYSSSPIYLTHRKTMKAIKRIQKESLTAIPVLDETFKKLIDDLKKDIDEKSWIRLRLFQIERIDAFVIHFSKFIARLYYLLSHNSKDYLPPYIRLNQKSEPRIKLKSILNDEMRKDYPFLSQYLYSLLYYFRDWRNKVAHNIDHIVEISNGVIHIVNPETGEKEEINLGEIENEIYVYSYFIEALGIPKIIP